MRILVTWGSQRGGTAEIAELIGEMLEREAYDVDLRPAPQITSLAGYDAVVIGGAIYSNRWHPDARRFVKRHTAALRERPVWGFSSGPLDDSADREQLTATRQAATLLERVGALGHVTFGGRLRSDALGFPAAAMARTRAGDWRNPERIRAWAEQLARDLRTAHPGVPVDHPAASAVRLIGHGALAWLAVAALVAAMLVVANPAAAMLVRLVAAPAAAAVVAHHYFRERAARDPAPAALGFVAAMVALDLAAAGVATAAGVAGLAPATMVTWVFGYWLAVALAAAATGVTGYFASMVPAAGSGADRAGGRRHRGHATPPTAAAPGR